MNEQNYRGNTVLLSIIGITTLLIAVVGATFAYFTAQLINEPGEENMFELTSGTLGLHLNGGNFITIPGDEDTYMYPRETAWGTKTFSIVANSTTNVEIPYTIRLNPVDSDKFSNGELVYSLRIIEADSDTDNGRMQANVTREPVLVSGAHVIAEGYFEGPTNSTHAYALSIYLPSTGNMDHLQGGFYIGRITIQSLAAGL